MSPQHFFLALAVVAIWGLNFVAIHVGLKDIPPILLCALRFFLAAFPVVFFLPRPRTRREWLLGYSLATFVVQFSFLLTGMRLGMPAGLASLVMQVQALFSVALAVWAFGDRPSRWKLAGGLVSFTGIFIVAVNFHSGTSLLGLLFTLLASFAWAVGNLFSKKINAASALGLVVWGSLLATPFLFLLSLVLEGPAAISQSLTHLSWVAILALAYTVYFSTYLGYSLWGFLLNKYPISTVAPFSLLVPVFGFLGAHLFLGEDFPAWKIFASALVLLGLALNVFEARIRAWFRRA